MADVDVTRRVLGTSFRCPGGPDSEPETTEALFDELSSLISASLGAFNAAAEDMTEAQHAGLYLLRQADAVCDALDRAILCRPVAARTESGVA